MPDLVALLPLVGIALLFWLLIVRPQSRRQQALRTIQGSVDVGTQVLLTSGLYGTVTSLQDDRIGLEIAPGVAVTVARGAVMQVVEPADPLSDPPTSDGPLSDGPLSDGPLSDGEAKD